MNHHQHHPDAAYSQDLWLLISVLVQVGRPAEFVLYRSVSHHMMSRIYPSMSLFVCDNLHTNNMCIYNVHILYIHMRGLYIYVSSCLFTFQRVAHGLNGLRFPSSRFTVYDCKHNGERSKSSLIGISNMFQTLLINHLQFDYFKATSNHGS